jgi:hypothetical protein
MRTPPILLLAPGLLLAACQAQDVADSTLDSAAEEHAADTGLTPSSWLTQVSRRIEADQRSFRSGDPGEFLVTVRDLHARLDADGLRASKGDGELSLRSVAWGRESAVESLDPISPVLGDCARGGERITDGSCLRRVELPHVGLTEYWRTTSAGFEQGWEIEQRPAGEGLLLLEVRIQGAIDIDLHRDALGLGLLDSAGQPWRYDGLAAWDAVGEPLAVWMEPSEHGLRILLDDTGARYPITVDPSLTEDDLITASDAASGDEFAYAVGGAGDVNGDGYDDAIVGAMRKDGESGAAYVYLGSASGLDTSTELKITASDGASSDRFGIAVSGAGDINSDGYDDIIVGASGDDDTGSSSGAAYVYHGSASGIDTSSETKLHSSSTVAYGECGMAVDGAGDVDGDGYDDVMVGCPYEVSTSDSRSGGAAYLFLGSASGVDTSTGFGFTASAVDFGDAFGFFLAGLGDTNGDGYADIAVFSADDCQDCTSREVNESGAAYIYLGSSSGLDTSSEVRIEGTGIDGYDQFAYGLSPGDVNGDGYVDLVVGAFGYNGGYGSVYVYLGSSSGIDTSTETSFQSAAVADDDWFGISVATGDVDGDGYDDVVVGAQGVDDAGTDAGAAYLYYGSASGIDTSTETMLLASDAADEDHFGNRLTTLGDVDADGYADFLVGAYQADGSSSDEGAAYTFHGGCRESTWYPDADGDGYGDTSTTTVSCSEPSGYVLLDGDCDDTDSAINPGVAEICDSVDNDCDGDVDDDDSFVTGASTYHRDADGDGYGASAPRVTACVPPSGFVADSTDCDDGDATVSPDATEICDGQDNNCDGDTDEASAADASTWYSDADSDGYGDALSSQQACSRPYGHVADDSDCDDTDGFVNPASTERCDGADNDCDGDTDEDDALDAATWYADVDGDGYGDPATTESACSAPSGYIADSSDCDDSDADTNPAADEYCDGHDDDCDGDTDEDDAVDADTWYADSDGDGYGDPATTEIACSAPSGHVDDSTDCDDSDADTNPDADEYCDGHDDDCDGATDEADAVDAATWYADSDTDGYGDAAVTDLACDAPSGYVADSTDCDDSDADTHPAADEYCDGHDDDCDGATDEADAVDAATWYADSDADGYGDAAVTDLACDAPSGYVSDATDCDDSDADTNPAADEYCDGHDDDCDGDTDEDDAVDAATWYADADGDGQGDPDTTALACSQPSGHEANQLDCDDTDANAPFAGGAWIGCDDSLGASVNFDGDWTFSEDAGIVGFAEDGVLCTICSGIEGAEGATKSVSHDTNLALLVNQPSRYEGGWYSVLSTTVRGGFMGCVVDEEVTVVATSAEPLAGCRGEPFAMLAVQRYMAYWTPFTGDEHQSVFGSLVLQLDYAGERTLRAATTEISEITVGDATVALSWDDATFTVEEIEETVRRPVAATVTYGNLSHTLVTTYEDSDGDSIPDLDEEQLYGTDPESADSDGDGVDDGCELAGGSDPTDPHDAVEADSDGDGLDLALEELLGTDPELADSDGDGVDDNDELADGTDPTDPDDVSFTDSDGNGIDDRYEDVDGDGLTGAEEALIGTDPTDADGDDDGLTDGEEVAEHGTDPSESDSDDDGLSDGEEVNEHGSDPTETDSDGDGLSDGEEVNEHGSDPTQTDSDGDGLSDGEEVNEHGTDPAEGDSDGDGLSDGEEVNEYGTDPSEGDSDGDGVSDGEEVESGSDPNDDCDTPDTTDTADTAEPDDTGDGGGDDDDKDEGCEGCASGGAPAGSVWLLLAGLAGLTVRRRWSA